jgi:ABC-2 type transport system permease protein
MRLREIVRFEVAYGLRRLHTWIAFVLLAVMAFALVRGGVLEDATFQDFYVNAPFVIAFVTVFGCLLWLLVGAIIAGEAAARDVATGMHPLTYTVPVPRAEVLGGRFLGALALNALLMLALPLGILLSVYGPGVEARYVGPFRIEAYLLAYGLIALPNVFIGTAIQFAWAALSRRPIAAYLGSVLTFFVAYGGVFTFGFFVERMDIAALFDVFGQLHIVADTTTGWTPHEKNTRLILLEGTLLYSRLFWLGIALLALALTYVRFRFEHPTVRPLWRRLTRRDPAPTPAAGEGVRRRVSVPQVRGVFGVGTYARQTGLIAGTSFRALAWGRGGIGLLAFISALVVVFVPENLYELGTPLLPRTHDLLTFLTTPITGYRTPWVVVPLVIVFWAGELVWREREAGLGEIADAAPVPDGVRFLGKLLGLGGLLVVFMGLLALAGVATQVRMGYYDFEVGLYLRVLLGLQLPEYGLFAVLALVLHGLVTQKYVGHLVVLVAYVFIVFAPVLFGIDHDLLVYGAGPSWAYSDMRGFGATLGPWAWFKLYWAAWALLLAVGARLFWVRGLEGGLRARLLLARERFTRPTAALAALAAALVVATGGFIYVNTTVRGGYVSADAQAARSADYERRYGRYAHAAQPRVAGTRLHVELYPERRTAEIRGTYRLVNRGAVPVDSIHVATVAGVETGPVAFDRTATAVVNDEHLGHRIYALQTPLRAGDSLEMRFTVRVAPRGFRSGAGGGSVEANGTYFTSEQWLPAIGYQSGRELIGPRDRRLHGLPARPVIPSLYDARARQGERVRTTFEAVMGTSSDQRAVAPGMLRRTWTENGRRYFHYAADAPIGTEQAFFSARYAVREARWQPPVGPEAGPPVLVQLYHDPRHTANVDRLMRSAVASLAHYSRQYGPYPWRHLRLIENPVRGMGAHADAASIDYGQGFSLFNPAQDPRGLDFPFAIIAHEVAHQWWGAQLPYAPVEGVGLLTESPAWYAAMGVVEETYGRAHLRRLLRFFRQPYPFPPIRQAVPLVRGADPFAAYRKGPFALFGLSEYIGKDRVDLAYRRMIERHGSGTPPLPTALDLYRELQAVTPDTLQTLVGDLFARNVVWDLETEQATATQTPTGAWRVTLRVRARKVEVLETGAETERPLDEWVQVGVFTTTDRGEDFGEALYLKMHRLRSGTQTITLTVPRQPADAGIDPYHLLYEQERFDNVERVEIAR